jgi:hypothetical protein
MFSLFARSQLAVSAAVIQNSELPQEEFFKSYISSTVKKGHLKIEHCGELTVFEKILNT